MKAFIIGEKDVVLGFQLAGVEGSMVSSKEEASEALKKAFGMRDIGIVFITEDFSTQIYDEITRLRSQPNMPFIVEVPGRSGGTGELYSTQKLLQKMLRMRV